MVNLSRLATSVVLLNRVRQRLSPSHPPARRHHRGRSTGQACSAAEIRTGGAET